jgi:hypothetical protein
VLDVITDGAIVPSILRLRLGIGCDGCAHRIDGMYRRSRRGHRR